MSPRSPVAIFIITRNEEQNLPFALASVRDWAQEVFVLDSGSTDGTREVAESMGAKFFYRAWDGYVNQKNWGLDNLPITAPWVFILDADEVITSELRDEIIRVASQPSCPENAFYVNRYLVFLGKRIKHCGYFPYWNVRFFRHGKARYEQRAVHEQMIVDGPVGRLRGEMEHWDRRGIEYYVAKHNLYSSLEAREMFNLLIGRTTAAKGSFWGDALMRRRWLKNKIWPRLPARPLMRWFYMYILRLGFLDGRVGFQFCLFLASYEHQISLKLREMLREAENSPTDALPPPVPAELPEPTPRTPNTEDRRPREDADIFQRFDQTARFPYSVREYAMRVAWEIVGNTLFRFSPRRAYGWRNFLLRLFGANIGSHAKVRSKCKIFHPWLLALDDWSVIGDEAEVYNLGPISIGKHSMISQGTYLCAGTHDHTLPDLPLQRPPIRIGSGVWICAQAFIGPGVSVGDNSVIGARAVVAKDIPAGVIAAGNPAKVIKARRMRDVSAPSRRPQLPQATSLEDGPDAALAGEPQAPAEEELLGIDN